MTDTLSPDRERDAELAELLGWRFQPLLGDIGGGYHCYGPDGVVVGWSIERNAPRYSTDPCAFEALLVEIGRRGLREKFIDALWRAVDTDPGEAYTEQAWKLFSAPLNQKAAAALAVLTERTNG